jgi:hypothetical protein
MTLDQLAHAPLLLAYLAGILTGWGAARRVTRYMLGGRA